MVWVSKLKKMIEDIKNIENRQPRIWGEKWPYQLQEVISGATSNEIRPRIAR
jgi:hypothetical protein